MASKAVKIPFTEAAAPSTPAAGDVVLYAKTDGLLYSKDDAGSETLVSSGVSLSNPMDGVGQLIQGGAAGAPAKLASQLIGKVPTWQGVGTAIAAAYPPGYEFIYTAGTSNVTPSSTVTPGTALVLTGGTATTFDGGAVMVKFFAVNARPDISAGAALTFWLWEDGVSLGRIGHISAAAAVANNFVINAETRVTPAAGTHNYDIKASVSAGTALIAAGNGGTAGTAAMFIRVTKV